MARPHYSNVDRALLIRLSVGYLLLILYGSLLPFNLNDLTLSAAWENFRQIPLLKLQVANRADLVANLLLYIPLGLLVCGGLVGENRQSSVLAGGMLLSLLLSATVALVLEFTQQFFAPRTVSLNDIYAELAGSVLGIALWPTIGARLVHLVQTISQGGTHAWYPLLRAYALAYAVLSLFPYDFLLSYDEWRIKLTSGSVGWLFAANCRSWCVARLIPEALLAAPLGMLIFSSAPQRGVLLFAAAAGVMLGVLIEGLQLTIASGISQGASIASRAMGMMAGVGLIWFAHTLDWHLLRQHVRPTLVFATVPYLVAVAWLNGWFSHHWSDLSGVWTRLADVHFVPFYYHYYSTETTALISLLFQAALYLPLGVGFWLWSWTGWSNRPERNNALPAIAAGLLASIIEGGKLFIPGKHPDPTNVLIAALAAIVANHVLYLLFNAKPAASVSPPTDALPVLEPVPADDPSPGKAIGGLTVICLAIGAALTTPLGMQWVLPLLVAYMALLWFKPGLWLVCVTAFLPLLDFTSLTGRLFWTEYDTLLLATIGIGYLRLRSQPHPAFRRPARLLLSLFALSAAISFGIGLLPLGPLDHNSFANYSSPYNALRVAKGLLFSLAFIPLLMFEWNFQARAARKLSMGITLGLAGTIAYILWERATFPGLFNFETEYRITGPFPGMHVGGGYIEGYLTAALPFVALFAWQQRKVWPTLLAVALYGLGIYCVMVTFSRGGQVAFALSTLVVLLGFGRLTLKKQRYQHTAEDREYAPASHHFSRTGAIIIFAGLAAVATAFSWPVISGKYGQSRWATTGADLNTRTSHWKDAVNIVRAGSASFFGMGLGSFPSTYFWNSTSSRPATYTFAKENGNSLLRLGSGDLLYFEQAVPVVPEQVYTLKLDLRAATRNSALTTKLCEKALLYSYTCTSAPLKITVTGQWEHREVQIHTAGFGPPGSQFKRPVKLSLYNSTAGTVIDVDNVALHDGTGNNLIQNGEFSDGMHHWFFSVDNYLPWHVENLYVNIFFEQGWFGIISFLSLIAYALARWLSRTDNKNDSLSLVLCAALIAFLAVGTLNSWADEPRLSFLFYLLLLTGLVADAQSGLVKQGNPLWSRQ